MNEFSNGDHTIQYDGLTSYSKGSPPQNTRANQRLNFSGTEVFGRSKPLLRWGEKDNRGILSSGWNPLKGASVCFADKSASDGDISIIIEPSAPGIALSVAAVFCIPSWPLLSRAVSKRAEAHGYFFKINAESGRVDMIHRCKPFRGKEERKLYKDCTHFGVSFEKCKNSNGVYMEGSTFTLSSGYSDKHFPTGLNFNPSTCQDIVVIVKAVNDLIRSVQGDIDNQENSRVYPLFCTSAEYQKQCDDYEESLIYDDDSTSQSGRRSDVDIIPNVIYLDTSAISISYCSAYKDAEVLQHEMVTATVVTAPSVTVIGTL